WRVGDPADMLRLADDELLTAVACDDALIEIADRRHGDLEARLRAFRRALRWIGAVSRLAGVGDGFQLGKAVADRGHGVPPGFQEVKPPSATGTTPPRRRRRRREAAAGLRRA